MALDRTDCAGFIILYAKLIEADDIEGRNILAEYISQEPISLERMSFTEESNIVLRLRNVFFYVNTQSPSPSCRQ